MCRNLTARAVIVLGLAYSGSAFHIPVTHSARLQRCSASTTGHAVHLAVPCTMQLAPRPNSGWSQQSKSAPLGTNVPVPMTLGIRKFALDHAVNQVELVGQSRIFLDSASVEDFSRLLPLGMIWGVTTNPSILERCGVSCSSRAIKDLAATSFQLGANEFMAQTWGGDDVGMLLDHGLQLASIDPRMVVKVPVTAPGLEAAALLRAQGVRVCTTAVYSPHQVVSSVAVGAEYAAPYLGRMNDAGKDGFAQVADMLKIVDKMRSKTRVLVASVRSVEDVNALASLGCTTFTLSAQVISDMTRDPMTLEAAANFEKAAMTGSNTKPTGMGFAI